MIKPILNIETLPMLFDDFSKTLEADEYPGYSNGMYMALDVLDMFLEWYNKKEGSTAEERFRKHQKTIAVDFDGVLHSYYTPIDIDEQHIISDPPVDGALEWVNNVLEHFDIIVYTARHVSEGGLAAVREWLEEWGFPKLEVTGVKPVARLYIDDRGFAFTGSNFPSIHYLRTFKPWNRKDGVWKRE
jgi:hypothetical protein